MAAKKKKKSAPAPKKSAGKMPAIKMKMKATTKKPAMKKATAAPKKPMAAKAVAMTAAGALLTPLDDRLLVQPEAAATKTSGGLFIPDSAGKSPNRGVVLAKGRGRRNKKGSIRPLDVSVGDQVLFADFAGTKITLAGKEVLILREEDVLGILN